VACSLALGAAEVVAGERDPGQQLVRLGPFARASRAFARASSAALLRQTWPISSAMAGASDGEARIASRYAS
jgi:hypothetical protein